MLRFSPFFVGLYGHLSTCRHSLNHPQLVKRVLQFKDQTIPNLLDELKRPQKDDFIEISIKVRLDPDFHTLVWPNDADFDPATLYNWHRGEGEELAKRASQSRRAGSHPAN